MKLFTKDASLDLSRIRIMGILNVTPDSFFDGGKYLSIDNAIKHVYQMIKDGATIIDVGGESTRPGSFSVSTEEELSRVIPVIEAIKKRFDVWISVDTSKPEVIYESFKLGAHIINDVRGLTEQGALNAAVETDMFICLMHMQGKPENMQKTPKYNDVFISVNNFFDDQIKKFEISGIQKSKLLLDPGFGFGKNLNHNYTLLSRLSEFHHFGLPLLVGMSRKTMIGNLLNLKPKDCLSGSLACATIAAMQGVKIIRTHDVKETIEAICVVEETLLAKKNYYR